LKPLTPQTLCAKAGAENAAAATARARIEERMIVSEELGCYFRTNSKEP
jgi:hypothetical protein